jgi:uncharacterized repeat protein (TIGR01451 family)
VVTPEEDGVLASWAEVSAATPVEINSLDNTLHITTMVEPAADVSLTLHVPAEVYVLDPTTTYTISVENGGPDDATGVVVTSTLPMSTTYQEGSSGCIAGAHEVTCTVGALPIGVRRTVTLMMRADEAHIVITHTAEVGAREFDPVLENNARSITRTVQPQADIAVRAWDTPDPVVVNRPLTYTIVVSNAGPSKAMGVTLTSVLPLSITGGWITTTQGTCVETQNLASLQVSCTLGALVKDEVLTVTMGVTPSHDGIVVNAVKAMAAEHDPYMANGNVDVETVVEPAADLWVSLVDWPDPVYVAYPLTYTIWVTNTGPDVAHDVRLTDTLPLSLTYMSAQTDQGRCEGNSGIFGDLIKCRLGMVPISGTAMVTLTVEPRESGIFTNQVAVSAYENDPNSLNDVAEEATTVRDWDADVRVAIWPSRDAVRVGDRLTYTVVVSNAGPFPATGVQLTHTLSPVLPYTLTASDWQCVTGATALTCTLPTSLSVRGSASLRVAVTPVVTGSIESRARARADEVDNNGENNFAVKPVQVSDVIVDLGVALTAQDRIVGGDLLLYTMVVSNAGPDSATGVWVTQTLPISVTYVAASEMCQQSGQVVSCTVGALDVGPTMQLTVAVGTPDVSSAVTVTSEAEVSGSEPDAVLGNNTDSWSTLIATTDFSEVYLPLVLRD